MGKAFVFLLNNMDQYLKLIGGLFIIASLFVCLGGFYNLFVNGKKISEESLIKGIGIAGLFVWIMIGFGIASWLISLIFMVHINFLGWISAKIHIPVLFVLVFLIALLFIIIVSFIKCKGKYLRKIKS
jgi:hypothetical protein